MGSIVFETAVPGYTRLPEENRLVSPGSPLAILGLWIKALRYRFQAQGDEPLPWAWAATLQDCLAGATSDPKPILIDAAYNLERSERNYRPGIYIDRGPVVPMKLTIDNRVGVRLPDDYRAFHAVTQTDINISIEAETAGESQLIADTVWMYVLASKDIIRTSFGFHDISNPVLGKTAIRITDSKVWVTPVDFSVQFDTKWTTRPLAPLLEEILTTIEANGETLDLYLNKIALQES